MRILGFTIAVARNGEMATLKGEMKISINRSSDNRLALVITVPNGGEIAAMVPREILHEAAELEADSAA